MDKDKIVQLIKEVMRQELDQMISNDRFIFRRNVEFENDINIDFGSRTGTMIGSSSSKLALFGTTPVNQPETISDPSGGATVDQPARDGVESIIARLKELGLIK